MNKLLATYLILYFLSSLIERFVTLRRVRLNLLRLVLALWIVFLLLGGAAVSAGEKLAFSCIGSLWLVKLCVRGHRGNNEGQYSTLSAELFYRFLWPGMSYKAFLCSSQPKQSDGGVFVRGYLNLLFGVLLFLALVITSPLLSDTFLGIVGLLPFLLTIHLGYASMLTACMRLLHFPVSPLFDRPLLSVGLSDFWSKRWNRPFVEMNRVLFFNYLTHKIGRRAAVMLAFFISGLLHELGISYPGSGGWGGPTCYFTIQGALLLFEESQRERFSRLSLSARRIWLWVCLLLPAPLLFHTEFRQALIIPCYRDLAQFVLNIPARSYLKSALTLAGVGHFLVLLASIQVPARLAWKDDLEKLRPFNKKLMWNYGLFIFLLIMSFGVQTLVFRDDMLSGAPAALGMASLIGGFWLLRILVDCFYFSHSDWPQGPEFVVGHTLLNSLFSFLFSAYGFLLLWHFLI